MNTLIPTRLSHLLSHCSVGAVVRGPHALVAVKDLREWTDYKGRVVGRPIRYVERVRAALGISQELREPPLAREIRRGEVEGVCVPTVIFPSWMRCPKCGLLHYKPWQKDKTKMPRCEHCQPNPPWLEQVTWVVAHQDGYMDDVPWHYLAHSNAGDPQQRQCAQDRTTNYLYFNRDKDNPTKWSLRCGNCGKNQPFQREVLKHNIIRMRKQPWLRESVQDFDPCPEILEINNVVLHIPETTSALVIPPESRIQKGTVVDRIYNSSSKRQQLERARTPLQREGLLRRMATELRCSASSVSSAFKEIQQGYPLYGEVINASPGQVIEDEYRALIEPIPDVADDEDFVTAHHTKEWKALAKDYDTGTLPRRIIRGVDRLIEVRRLRKVLIFKGFSRIMGPITKPDIVGESSWLPAIDLHGEGIFITLADDVIMKWEQYPALVSRSEIARLRYQKSNMRFDVEVTPRFLLLHTLSHLLIRELESQAGYPAASLTERIYCTQGKDPMAGILIYVAVPDVVGSLGGIAEMASPSRFLRLLNDAFVRADWCSYDPVCSEQEGQGPFFMNRAACHACALIPEPSCTYGNTLLDRTFIKGLKGTSKEECIPAFLDYADEDAE